MNWVNESKNFDDQYTDSSPLSWVPFIGNYVKNDLQFRQELVLNFMRGVEGKKIIDIGCGVGRLSHILASRGSNVVGYDISREAIVLANKYRNDLNLQEKCKFEVIDITGNITFPEADYWVALGVWQYLDSPEEIIKKLSHIPNFITDVPIKYHWINPLRKIYRTLFKGIHFKSFTLRETYALFNSANIMNIHVDRSNPTIYLISRKKL